MDPATTDFLRRTRTRGRQPLSGLSVQQARQFPSWFELLFGPAPELATMRSLSIPALDGTPLHARLYADDPAADSLVVYFHGGGWVLGSVAAFEAYTALLAKRTGTAVLSVDYRLAPEHPFPTPVDDAEAALRFASGQGERLLGRPLRRLVVMGDSAGATLATVAARRVAAAGDVRGADLQVLVYPVTDAGLDTPSYREFAEGHLLTADDMRWFWNHYCADPARRLDPEASPLRADGLGRLPPTLLFSAELDPLRDEGERYAERLREAGVDCEMLRCPGVLHSFLAMANTLPTARSALDEIVRRMRARLA